MRTKLAILAIVLAGSAHGQTVFDPAGAVTEEALQASAGKADLGQVAMANQENIVARNSVSGNSVTGAVGIAGNAFQNLNGLSIVNANSGNNVAINAAMNVNVAILPR